MEIQNQPVIEDDPLLGRFIANHTANRLRLLMIAGAVLGVVWFVVTVTLWQVEPVTAFRFTLLAMTVSGLIAGWFVAHLWNREVILFEHGFTFRRGSQVAHIPYQEVKSSFQSGQQVAYFGGLFRRSTLRFTLVTDKDEVITLTHLYVRLEALIARLEAEITLALVPKFTRELADGVRLSFGPDIEVSAEGLHHNGHNLAWSQLGDFSVKAGQLILNTSQGELWHSLALKNVENIRAFLMLLNQRKSA